MTEDVFSSVDYTNKINFKGWHKIMVDRGARQVWIKLKVTRNQLNEKITLIRSAILKTLVPWYLQQQITLSIFLTGTAWPYRKAQRIVFKESVQNKNKSTATVLNKDMQPTHLCVCHLFSIYQTYGKFIFCRTQSIILRAIFHCFEQVIKLDNF